MELPPTLDGWTLPLIRELLTTGVSEDERFDWKEMVPVAKDEGGKARLKDVAASFANGDGGYLIFGVKDDPKLSADERIVGVDDLRSATDRFSSYVNKCDPPVRFAVRNPTYGSRGSHPGSRSGRGRRRSTHASAPGTVRTGTRERHRPLRPGPTTFSGRGPSPCRRSVVAT